MLYIISKIQKRIFYF